MGGIMYIKDVFEAVQVDTPCSQPKFLSYLHITVQFLMSKYGTKYVIGKSTYTKPVSLDEDIPVDEAYFPAVVDNIGYMVSHEENRKVDFVEEAENAYRAVWSRYHGKGKFLARGYYDV
jgi:hypothetical protein